MYLDWTYIVLVLPAVVFSLWASSRVNGVFARYQDHFLASGLTGAEAAAAMLRQAGVYDVRIERVSGRLSDHYDPRTNVIRLSDGVYGSSSAVAVGVACHEAGHALQYAGNYFPVRLRMAIIPVTRLGSGLAVPLILIGILFSYTSSIFITVAYIGVGCFALSTVFQLVTLPVEFNASRRALAAIHESGFLRPEEEAEAKEILSAAAMTYVAALAVSITQLLRFLLLVGRRDNRRR